MKKDILLLPPLITGVVEVKQLQKHSEFLFMWSNNVGQLLCAAIHILKYISNRMWSIMDHSGQPVGSPLKKKAELWFRKDNHIHNHTMILVVGRHWSWHWAFCLKSCFGRSVVVHLNFNFLIFRHRYYRLIYFPKSRFKTKILDCDLSQSIKSIKQQQQQQRLILCWVVHSFGILYSV